MTKAELVESISNTTELSKTQVDSVLDCLATSIQKNVLKNGDSITIPGLGTFKQKKRAARTGRNPQTGETLKIKASTSIGFKMSSSLKK